MIRAARVRLMLYSVLALAAGASFVARSRWEGSRVAKEHGTRGMLAFQAGDLATAATELRREIVLTPNRARAHYNLGLVELRKGDHPAARAALSRAVALHVDQPEANCALGLATFRMSDYSAAVAPLLACLRTNPEDDDARYLLAQSFLGQARLDEAEHEFKILVERQPTNGRFQYALATAYLFRPATAAVNTAALTALEAAVRAPDAPPGAHYSLGLIYRRLERWPDAARSLERAVRHDPEMLEARRTLGLIYRRLGRPAEADAQFRAARAAWARSRQNQRVTYLRDEVMRNPANPITHYQLGCLYLEFGDQKAARNQLETALSLDPSLSAARDRLNRLTRRGD